MKFPFLDVRVINLSQYHQEALKKGILLLDHLISLVKERWTDIFLSSP